MVILVPAAGEWKIIPKVLQNVIAGRFLVLGITLRVFLLARE